VQRLILNSSGASDVHIVSHMTRRATFAEAQNDAKSKSDTDFVTKNNPAVSEVYLAISRPRQLNFFSDSSTSISHTVAQNRSCSSISQKRKQREE